MGINLGGGQVGVPQQHLHHPEIGAVIKQMGRERVTQAMRIDRIVDSGMTRMVANPLPDRLAGERTTAARNEYGLSSRPQGRSTFLHPHAQRFDGGFAERNKAFPTALAADADNPPIQPELSRFQSGQFADPDAGRVERLEDCPVANTQRVFAVGGCQKGFNLGRRQRAG